MLTVRKVGYITLYYERCIDTANIYMPLTRNRRRVLSSSRALFERYYIGKGRLYGGTRNATRGNKYFNVRICFEHLGISVYQGNNILANSPIRCNITTSAIYLRYIPYTVYRHLISEKSILCNMRYTYITYMLYAYYYYTHVRLSSSRAIL